MARQKPTTDYIELIAFDHSISYHFCTLVTVARVRTLPVHSGKVCMGQMDLGQFSYGNKLKKFKQISEGVKN